MIPNIINPLGITEHVPLTLKALESSTVKMTVSTGSPTVSGLKFRTQGQPWTPYTIDDEISLNAGDSVQFKNEADTLNSSGNTVRFALTGKLEAFGELMSLLNASACSNYCFASLFSSNNALYSCKGIQFPVNLATGCLQSAFAWCQQMYEGPELLPAKTLASVCYAYMFQGDTRLRKMAFIPALQLSSYCMQYMYHYAGSSLSSGMETVPLLAVTLGTNSLANAFNSAKISRLEVNFTSWTGTSGWVTGVPGSGTFVKPLDLPEEIGSDYIPSGWAVVNK